jgi:uncharacterized protein YdeI (YjbR/CyaY-like superfamily)
MTSKKIAQGTVHRLPKDLRNMLEKNPQVFKIWEDITPLARNEWICWTTSVKKAETREKHVVEAKDKLLQGNKRPCCWPGCPHRDKNRLKPK